MVARRVAALALLVLAEVSATAEAARVRHQPGLLRKQSWDWKTASDESQTEWNIVLRRYYMVDMELADLLTQFSSALPVSAVTGLAQLDGHSNDELDDISTKLKKLTKNMDAAQKDQDTGDNTFSQFEIDTTLSDTEKGRLHAEHMTEKQNSEILGGLASSALGSGQALLKALSSPALAAMEGLEAPAASAAVAVRNGTAANGTNATNATNATKNATSTPKLQQATFNLLAKSSDLEKFLLKALEMTAPTEAKGDEAKAAAPHRTPPNATVAAGAAAAAVPVLQLYAQFQNTTTSFRTQRQAFEDQRKASVARLIALGKRFSKVVLK